MENNENHKSIFVVLILIIIILFSILFYSWLETFGLIGNDNTTTISILLEETVEKIPEPKKKKVVIEKDESKEETISAEEKEKILESLKEGEEKKSVITPEVTESYQVESENIDTSRFYYNQINDVAKKIYDKLYENKENLKTGNYKIEFGDTFNDILKQSDGGAILKDAYSQAVRSFLFDNPKVFFLDIPKMCLFTETKTTFFSKEYSVSIMPQEGSENYLSSQFPTEAIVNSATSDIRETASKIKTNTEGLSQIEKISYIHDYLVKNIEYDSTLGKTNIYNIFGALVNNVAVCEGYAKAFKYLLDEVGIPSIIVLGNATNSENVVERHSWNYIYLDGKWYGVDATFDDPIIVGGIILSDNVRHTYFMKGKEAFSKLHNVNSEEILEFFVEYPELCDEDYK